MVGSRQPFRNWWLGNSTSFSFKPGLPTARWNWVSNYVWSIISKYRYVMYMQRITFFAILRGRIVCSSYIYWITHCIVVIQERLWLACLVLVLFARTAIKVTDIVKITEFGSCVLLAPLKIPMASAAQHSVKLSDLTEMTQSNKSNCLNNDIIYLIVIRYSGKYFSMYYWIATTIYIIIIVMLLIVTVIISM